MRRRWLLILSGMVALGIATVLALTIFVPRAPFRFLDGHKPLSKLHLTVFDYGLAPRSSHLRLEAMSGFECGDSIAYSFRGDAEKLARVATAELVPNGFVDHSGFYAHHFERGDTEVLILPTRIEDLSAASLRHVGSYDAGWVTVLVTRPPEPSVWDRVKAAFGL